LDKVSISSQDGTTTITMPRVKSVTVGASEVSKSVTMASGKVVKDMIGFRPTVTAQWDWLPANTISALAKLLASGGFFSVKYPAPAGEASGTFEIDYPTMSVFAYKNGVPVWHDVKLTMTGQGVMT
jgi:hypothetical protein